MYYSLKLSTLAIWLGLGVVIFQIYQLTHPEEFRKWARRFPRSLPAGIVLMAVATLWFLWEVKQENIADFAPYKPWMLFGFATVGVAACIFVQDFLAVRGLALVLLLLAKLIVDTARWADTEWRLVMVIWAYVLVFAGIWLTLYPWRLRDLIHWSTETTQRIRWTGALRLAFGLLVLILGLTVY